jgi:hypothetical protein
VGNVESEMTPGEVVTALSASVLAITQLGGLYVLISKSRRDAQEAREDRARRDTELKAHLHEQDEKLVELHASTNGLSKRAEDLAKMLGEATGLAKGKAEEKANPS